MPLLKNRFDCSEKSLGLQRALFKKSHDYVKIENRIFLF